MGIIKKLKGKSKAEKDIEREIRYRKAKSTISNYIQNLEKVQKQVFDQGKKAISIGDETFAKRQAKKHVGIQDRIRKGQRLLLLMEEAKLQRNLVNISGDFVVFAKDIAESILEGPDVEQLTEMQIELEKGLARAEQMDEALSVMVESASEGILASENMTDENVDALLRSMEGDAIDEESELDQRISKGVNEIEEKMKLE